MGGKEWRRSIPVFFFLLEKAPVRAWKVEDRVSVADLKSASAEPSSFLGSHLNTLPPGSLMTKPEGLYGAAAGSPNAPKAHLSLGEKERKCQLCTKASRLLPGCRNQHFQGHMVGMKTPRPPSPSRHLSHMRAGASRFQEQWGLWGVKAGSEPETASLPVKPDPGPLPFGQAAWPRPAGEMARRFPEGIASNAPALTGWRRMRQGVVRESPSFSA